MPTARAGVSVEAGWRVKVTESMADGADPAVRTSALLGITAASRGCEFAILGKIAEEASIHEINGS